MASCLCEPQSVNQPILRGLPYAISVQLQEADGTPYPDLSGITVKLGLQDRLGTTVAEFAVSQVGQLFVLRLSREETATLAASRLLADLLVGQAGRVAQRATLSFFVETPRTDWGPGALTSDPETVLVVRDQVSQILAFPGGLGPGGMGASPVTVDFSVPLQPWIVNHNLGRYPPVQVLNAAGQVVTAEINHVSINQFRVEFNFPQVGSVVYT